MRSKVKYGDALAAMFAEEACIKLPEWHGVWYFDKDDKHIKSHDNRFHYCDVEVVPSGRLKEFSKRDDWLVFEKDVYFVNGHQSAEAEIKEYVETTRNNSCLAKTNLWTTIMLNVALRLARRIDKLEMGQ